MDKLNNFLDCLGMCYREILNNPFDHGFCCGVALCLAIILLFFAFKLIIKSMFKVRKCKAIQVEPKDHNGTIEIQVSAIEEAIRSEISKFHSISIGQVRLFRKKSRYILKMNCIYDGRDGNIAEIRSKLNEKIFVIFQDFLGVKNLKTINLIFEKASFENYMQTKIVDKKDENNQEIILEVLDSPNNQVIDDSTKNEAILNEDK